MSQLQRSRPARHRRVAALKCDAVIPRVLAQLRRAEREAMIVDQATWTRIAGATRARGSRPVRLHEGQLQIRVQDASLRYAMQLDTPRLLKALRQTMPTQEIQEIVFAVGDVSW